MRVLGLVYSDRKRFFLWSLPRLNVNDGLFKNPSENEQWFTDFQFTHLHKYLLRWVTLTNQQFRSSDPEQGGLSVEHHLPASSEKFEQVWEQGHKEGPHVGIGMVWVPGWIPSNKFQQVWRLMRYFSCLFKRIISTCVRSLRGKVMFSVVSVCSHEQVHIGHMVTWDPHPRRVDSCSLWTPSRPVLTSYLDPRTC